MPDLPLWQFLLIGWAAIGHGFYVGLFHGAALWGALFAVLGVVVIYLSVLVDAEALAVSGVNDVE